MDIHSSYDHYQPHDGRVSKMQSLSMLEVQEKANHEQAADDAIIKQVMKYYTDCLLGHERARAFLQQRCLNDTELIKRFNLGYADRSLGLRLRRLPKLEEQVSRGSLQRVGLLKPSGHEFFRGAIVFPFMDVSLHVVGGYGRRITDKLKHGSVYHVHWLSEHALFFNGQCLQTNTKDSVILCKNPIDTLSWIRAGFSDVLGLMGCESFTQKHAQCLAACKVTAVYIAFGISLSEWQAASAIAKQVKALGILPYVVLYPDALDANGLIQQADNPHEALQRCLDNAVIPASMIRYTTTGKRFK